MKSVPGSMPNMMFLFFIVCRMLKYSICCIKSGCFPFNERTTLYLTKLFDLDKRLKILLNFFVGPALFIILSWSIYNNITHQPDLAKSLDKIKLGIQGRQGWKAVLVIVLMFANWSCEALKWKVLINHIQPISFFRSFRAILSGLSISLAMNTPNGSGEYIGRVLYVKEGNRIRAVTLTFVGSLSQLIITMLMGTLGVFILRSYFYNPLESSQVLSRLSVTAIVYGCLVFTLILLTIYFEISYLTRFIEKIPFVARFSYFIQKLEDFGWKELLKVLAISFLRYLVFMAQYLLLLQVFNVGIALSTACWLISIMFLALAIVPTIALAELGIRGKISIFLFGLFSTNSLGIILTASAIWLINLVVPALAGSLFMLGIKLFKREEKQQET